MLVSGRDRKTGRTFSLIILLIVLISMTASADRTKRNPWADKPNIIIVFTDDHGYTDLGAYGIDEQVDTPQMDALARNGAIFTDAYCTAPQCMPSRVGLMLGQYQNRVGFRTNADDYLPLTAPDGSPVLTIADRLRAQGYTTGMVGKWHIGINTTPKGQYPGAKADYEPRGRGFDEYWEGPINNYRANFTLQGQKIPHQTVSDKRNRIDVQTEAAQAFIRRNHSKPFFLYLAYFGPHIPRIAKNDPYYLNYPTPDYPHYEAWEEDIRRQGLALVKAIDTGVGRVMSTIHQYPGLEERTLILFTSDNGSPHKLGNTALRKSNWTGSDNIPLRGEKGSLWEGGIKVPGWAYWKGQIAPGTIIREPVITLDFAATALALAGGGESSELDGQNIARLLRQSGDFIRQSPFFWSYSQEMAVRKGDWKLRLRSDAKYLFNLAQDPNELVSLTQDYPDKVAELEAEMAAYEASLPPSGQGKLGLEGVGDARMGYVTGAVVGTASDPRYVTPQSAPQATAYPQALLGLPLLPIDSDGDGKFDSEELTLGRDPLDAGDFGFEFNTDGDFEDWDVKIEAGQEDFLDDPAVSAGFLIGENVEGNRGQFENHSFRFLGDTVPKIKVRVRSPHADGLVFRWATSSHNGFAQERTLTVSYSSGGFQEVTINLAHRPDWQGQTITKMRLNPCNKPSSFAVDWIRADTSHPDTVRNR